MMARPFIKRHVPGNTGDRLLHAVDMILRYERNMSFHEYMVSDLLEDIESGRLGRQRGIGQVKIQALKDKLREHGYLNN